ncbi:MAG: hypothetical protein AAF943_02590 [Pseudomonadota bacterium]
MTGPHGALAYFSPTVLPQAAPAFDYHGNFSRALECAFAQLSAFAANSNHPPSDQASVMDWDAGIDLLFRIAGARKSQ